MHLFRFSIFMWFIYAMRRMIWNILIDKSPPRRKSCFNHRNWHISISCEKCTVFWIYLLISVCMTDSVLWLFMLLAPFRCSIMSHWYRLLVFCYFHSDEEKWKINVHTINQVSDIFFPSIFEKKNWNASK